MSSSRFNTATIIALLSYSAVMISLTMLKSFYRIGYLWDPEEQRQRGLSFVPLGEFSRGDSWFAPLFGYVGNVAFFIPFGVLLYFLLHRTSAARTLGFTALGGLALSLAMETAQYAFSLGFSDIDDVIMNTIGAALGAGLAMASDKILGLRARWAWVGLAILLGVVFAVLVGLGERLGDPDKVVEVAASITRQ